MKTKSVIILFLLLSSAVFMAFLPEGVNAKKPIYLNTAYSFQERAADLVSRMTLEEKQSQLGNTMPAIPRLGVNAYDIWGEALHGVVGRTFISGKSATSFPNSVAMGAAWDPELMKRETSVISDEARGFNYDVIYTLTYWSPVVEPMRDPRWGRTGESFGEDPFLISEIGRGFIQGLMGDDPVYLKTVPTGKHYFANNSEYNRHTGSADMDDRDMREFYLVPYRTLITKYSLPSIMTAYSATNGTPMSASKFYVDTIARKTYGLIGYVTGDCDAVSDIFTGHHYAKSNAEATAMGLKSGVDTDCGNVYQASTIDALKQGLITEADIDRALVNVFTIRMRIGEFDPKEMVPYAGIKPSVINDPSHNDLALEIATKTPVLLKNNLVAKSGSKALPLKAQTIKKIAVIGPQADKVELGPYSGQPLQANRISPLAGIKNYIAENKLNTEVGYVSGGNTTRQSDFYSLIGFTIVNKDRSVKEYDATKFDASSEGLVKALTGYRSGSLAVRGIKDGDWTTYNGIDIANADSIKFNMSIAAQGGLIEVRLGSPTGNMIASSKVESRQQGMGFGRTSVVPVKINNLGITGQQNLVFVYRAPEMTATDKETLALAESSDVAIVFVGTDESTAREEADRSSLILPGNQNELIKSVSAVNPNTIVVIQSLGMIEVEAIKNNPNVSGIIWTGFNGQAQGTAMAKILFGDVNPGGKLNATWYKSLNDIPGFADYTLRGNSEKNGRTYWYFKKDVSYEFGYGLSYTTFGYSNFAISKANITPNDKITLKVDVANTGDVDGDEIVQIYVRTPDSPASLERPIKRLKGFKKVTIAAGQTKTVSIDVDCSDLWFWDTANKKIMFDKGKYVFEFAASSKDVKGQVEANMSGSYIPVLRTVVAECGQVVLRPGNTVQTSVTAAMSDDSFFDLKKAEIIYKSNNPSVASVDQNGKVTATGVGTATIYAYVTVNGKTVSGSYPLKVMPDLAPASVSVNGKTIKDFRSDLKAYSYVLKGSSAVPAVNAVAAGKNVSVNVKQASAIPGTAEVTLRDDVTMAENDYFVNFGVKSQSDEFNSGTLGSQWTWVRENPANWSLTKMNGSLLINSKDGDIAGSRNNAENLLLQSANTDWTIETKIAGSAPSGATQNAGIVAYGDDDNFVKLVYRTGNRRRPGQSASDEKPVAAELLLENNGYQKSVSTVDLTGLIKNDNSLIIRLVKKGSIYTALYSLDGKKFETIGNVDLLLKDVKAGLLVCNGIPPSRPGNNPANAQQADRSETPFEVAFDYFRITNTGLK
jgi:beta-glucosidase-like glycosyl hydrolase